MKAQLISAPLRYDLSFEVLRNLKHHHSITLAKQQNVSRKKMLRYARWARTRGFSKGYIEGAAKHSDDILEALAGINRCYQEALEIASQDTQSVARRLVAQVIEDISTKDSQHLEKWIRRALSFLKNNRPVTLYYNPRYDDVIQAVRTNIAASITIQALPDLEHTDFYLEQDSGGIEFCWREIIDNSPCTIDTNIDEESHAQ